MKTFAVAALSLVLFVAGSNLALAGKGKPSPAQNSQSQNTQVQQYTAPVSQYGYTGQDNKTKTRTYVAQQPIQQQNVQQQDNRGSLKLVPTYNEIPRLGFHSVFVANVGERVTEVQYGSRAASLGLEPNDVILAVNGERLLRAETWFAAIERAAYNGGDVSLRILDTRTGNVAYRSLNLYGNSTTTHVHYYSAAR